MSVSANLAYIGSIYTKRHSNMIRIYKSIHQGEKYDYHRQREMYRMPALHCAAICPQNAITYNSEKAVLEETRPLPLECGNNLELLIRQRRSYRRFLPQKLDRAEISGILDIASHAPSAKNEHPTHFIVVDNDAVIAQMMKHILDYCKQENVCPEIPEQYAQGNNPVLGENAPFSSDIAMPQQSVLPLTQPLP